MRTNVVLNDDLMREAMQYVSARTRRAPIEEALRTFVDVKAAERRRRPGPSRTTEGSSPAPSSTTPPPATPSTSASPWIAAYHC
ncbi:MAG: type II toxin-antitoxin system VapB family antitoxin [Gemmatimonadota bacterium]